jgi:hypothetical protein
MKGIHRVIMNYHRDLEDFDQEKIKENLILNIRRQKDMELKDKKLEGCSKSPSKSNQNAFDSFKVPDDPSYNKGGCEVKVVTKELGTKKQPLDKFMILDLIKENFANSKRLSSRSNDGNANGENLAGTLHVNSQKKLFGLDSSLIKPNYVEVDQKNLALIVSNDITSVSILGKSVDEFSFDEKNGIFYERWSLDLDMDLFGELGICNGRKGRENFRFPIENQSPMKPEKSNPEVLSFNFDDPESNALPLGRFNSYDVSTN